jgi:TonB-dependent SusC/RagA subfamily outer membrane receptor
LIVAVVIGCGRTTQRPEQAAPADPAATGAVTTVVPSETDARVTRVEEMLRGVAGLDVTRLPDGGYQLRIRGHRSIRGNPGDDDPLVVIDGIPISREAVGSALAALAPGDVARIEVLKDAGATGFYGSRGANGVIVITTKRAR